MANTIKLKRGSGSDPGASDLVVGEVAVRTDTGKLFTKKDDNSVTEIGVTAVADGSITSAKIADGAIVNADVNASAAIAGTKISPDFGSQNVTTTGNVGIGTGAGTSTPLHVVGSDNTTTLLVESTDADANVGPIIELFRNSGSPADNDALGRIDFRADDESGNVSTFARIAVTAIDVTNNTEDARIDFTAVSNDTFNPQVSITGTGLDVTGNITVSGTVDGRDVATDGTKLDGIESGATADQSASEIVALIADQTIAPSAIDMEDNEEIRLGNSDDLKIFHNGSGSYLRDSGTGNLELWSNTLVFRNAAGNEVMAAFLEDGTAKLYYDNVQTLETTSTGVNVTGDLVTSDDVIINGTTNDESVLRFYDGGAGSWMIRQTNSDNILSFRRNSTNYLQLQANGNVDINNGLDVTGDISVSGTVDGRDVATDGTKLDGIASGATNVTNTNQLTNGAGFITATLTNEEVQDIVGGMVTGNTESGISVTYQDGDGTLDFVVGTLNQDTTGTAAIATTVTVADESSDTSCSVLYSTDASGNVNIKSGSNLTFNSSSGLLVASGFSGDGSSLSAVNAATLDSIDSSQFLRSDTADTATGVLTINGGLSFGADASCPAAVSSLTDGSTITVDFSSGIHHSVTLGGNRTLGNPANTSSTVGQCGSIFITQDGTGSRTLSYHSDFKFVGGTAPTLSTAANAVDRLDYVIKANNVVHLVVSLDVK